MPTPSDHPYKVKPPVSGTAEDIRLFVNLIMDHFWFVITVTLVVFAVTSIVVFRMSDVYTATTKIMLGESDKSALSFKEISQDGEVRPQRGDVSQIEVLTSRPVLVRTVQELELQKHYAVPESEYADISAADELKDCLEANLVRNTQVVALSIKDSNPKMAAAIANSMANHFIRETYLRKLYRSEQLLKWLPNAGQQLKEGAALDQLTELDDPRIIESLPSVMNDPVIAQIRQQLVELDSEIQELSKRYKEKHPKMKELNAKMSYLKSEMKIQTEKIIMNLKAGLSGAFGVNNIQVIEKAEIPYKPSGPKRLLIIAAATVGAFLISLFLAGVQGKMNQKVRSSESLSHLSIPFLGYLPTFKNLDQKGKSFLRALNFQSREWDDVINFKSSVVFSMPAERKKRLLLTSVLPNEGKSTVASLLAVSLAQSGESVLLVDLDMRRSSLDKKFKIVNEVGLSNFLIGDVSLEEAVQLIPDVDGLSVMTAGKHTPNPAMLLSSLALDRLFQEADARYDKIIFDAPPALHISDALNLTSKVHGTVLVFQSGKVHEDVARKLIEKIKLSQGEVIGAVINQTNLKELGHSYYQHYNEYSRYYKHLPIKK